MKDQILSLLTSAPKPEEALPQALHLVLAHFHSDTGTIHLLDPQTRILRLAAQSGLPPSLLETVRSIPVGKGIAGQTVARGIPVSLCNLQTEGAGIAQPAARATGVGGALCVPLRNGDAIVGTIGIGTFRPHQYSTQETLDLEEVGRLIGKCVSRQK